MPIKVPRLADRKGEVEFLLNKFLERFAGQHGKAGAEGSAPSRSISSRSYPWPGNVRELRNYAERVGHPRQRATLSLPSAISFPSHIAPTQDAIFGDGKAFPTLGEVEKRLIYLALKSTSGNRNEAANLIGINVRTLRNKLKEYEGKGDAEEKPELDEEGSARHDREVSSCVSQSEPSPNVAAVYDCRTYGLLRNQRRS